MILEMFIMCPVENTILVRKMEEKDIPAIISLDERISARYRPEMWQSEVQRYLVNKEHMKSVCLVAEIHEQVVGFMIGAVHPWLFGVENGGWIEILGVDPVHSGKGVGKKLGERILEEFKSLSIDTVLTTVDWRSNDLLEFFKVIGMTKSGFITLVSRDNDTFAD